MANLSKRKACVRNSVVLKDLALFWDLISLKDLVYFREIQAQSLLLCLMYNSDFFFFFSHIFGVVR